MDPNSFIVSKICLREVGGSDNISKLLSAKSLNSETGAPIPLILGFVLSNVAKGYIKQNKQNWTQGGTLRCSTTNFKRFRDYVVCNYFGFRSLID